jgi:hypothetical protein
MLVVAAGLLVKSLRNLLTVDPGYRVEHWSPPTSHPRCSDIASPLRMCGSSERC